MHYTFKPSTIDSKTSAIAYRVSLQSRHRRVTWIIVDALDAILARIVVPPGYVLTVIRLWDDF
jgi:hypothetical protein